MFSPDNIRIVHIDGYRVDIRPSGPMLVAQHTDKPGIIGKVGTLLGDAGINIAGMHVGRESGEGSKAVMVLKLDAPMPEDVGGADPPDPRHGVGPAGGAVDALTRQGEPSEGPSRRPSPKSGQ